MQRFLGKNHREIVIKAQRGDVEEHLQLRGSLQCDMPGLVGLPLPKQISHAHKQKSCEYDHPDDV
jgi:hypothetical protein